jgi:hypothetical protein
MKTEIHFNNDEMTEMTVYLPEENKTYFLSADNYSDDLRQIKCPYAEQIEKEIKEFLEK